MISLPWHRCSFPDAQNRCQRARPYCAFIVPCMPVCSHSLSLILSSASRTQLDNERGSAPAQRDRPPRGSAPDCPLRAFPHVRYAPHLELVANPRLRVASTGCVEIRVNPDVGKQRRNYRSPPCSGPVWRHRASYTSPRLAPRRMTIASRTAIAVTGLEPEPMPGGAASRCLPAAGPGVLAAGHRGSRSSIAPGVAMARGVASSRLPLVLAED